MTHRALAALGLVLLALGFTACGVSADLMTAVGFLGVGILAWPLTARAGAPIPCDGYEVQSCDGRMIQRQCCPAGARCNFEAPPYELCGNQTCVLGSDRGRCPSPQPTVDTKTKQADCRSGWVDACVSKKVTRACVLPMPTNFSGPSHNPPYRTCGEDRCTTHTFIEDCFPTKAELGAKACDGAWTDVCLGGKVEPRCLKPVTDTRFEATTFTICPDKSCVVGDSAAKCPTR